MHNAARCFTIPPGILTIYQHPEMEALGGKRRRRLAGARRVHRMAISNAITIIREKVSRKT
jgi:hypothetical protein